MTQAHTISASEYQIKLDMIAVLSTDELRGWWGHVHGPNAERAMFNGERAALLKRANELGVTL